MGYGRVSAGEKVKLAGILLVAGLVRVPGLGESLWYDEIGFTPAWFRHPEWLSISLSWKDLHPPFYTLVMLAWTTFFGDSEVVLRLPSLLCGLASIGLVWNLARAWLGPGPALLSAALLALSPPHLWYSHENKANMLLLLLVTATVWFYWSAAERGARSDWIAGTLILIESLYTHAYAVPMAVVVFVWLWWRCASQRSLLRPVLASGLTVGLAWLPFALVKFVSRRESLEVDYLRQLSPGELYKLLLVWLPHGNTLRTIDPYASFSELVAQGWACFLVDGFFALVLLRGLSGAGRRALARAPEAWSMRLLLLWFWLPLAVTMGISVLSQHCYIERNLIVILPPFVMLLALGVRGLRAASVGLLALALAATLNLLYAKTDLWTVYKFKPDWRGAAGYLCQEVSEHGRLDLLVTVPTLEWSYYGPRLGFPENEVRITDLCSVGPARALRSVRQRGSRRFYVVCNTTWLGCWESTWSGFARCTILEKREFRGLILYKLEMPANGAG